MTRSLTQHLPQGVVTAIVLAHLLFTSIHGDAHGALDVTLPPLKNLFVYVVILAGPLVGAGLTWTRWYLPGLWVVLVSMLGALLFGVYHHYVWVSPDNVHFLPEGAPAMHEQFSSSAAVLALLELAAVVWAALLIGRESRVPA